MYAIGQRVKCQEADLDEIGMDVMPAGVYTVIGFEKGQPYTVLEEETNVVELFQGTDMYIVQGADGESYNIMPSVIEGVE